MKSKSLTHDYLTRATHRLAALEVLFERKSWPDVIRESQEVVELTLKALLRHVNIEVPRLHDVSGILEMESDRLPRDLHAQVEKLAEISRQLRRDRELAFYGSEDLTPLDFYKEKDAKAAKDNANWVVDTVKKGLGI